MVGMAAAGWLSLGNSIKRNKRKRIQNIVKVFQTSARTVKREMESYRLWRYKSICGFRLSSDTTVVAASVTQNVSDGLRSGVSALGSTGMMVNILTRWLVQCVTVYTVPVWCVSSSMNTVLSLAVQAPSWLSRMFFGGVITCIHQN